MNLFQPGGDQISREAQPLAARLRPETLDQFTGQAHLLGESGPIREALDNGKPHSMILWGPPGSGKTTLARIVSRLSGLHFEEFSAIYGKKEDVRRVTAEARSRLTTGRRTLLFVDEFHRFNALQQDAFLPAVEDGSLILVGATTENPYFSLNSALLSRVKVYKLAALTEQDLEFIVRRALKEGFEEELSIDDGGMERLLLMSGGDARSLLNTLELAAARLEGDAITAELIDKVTLTRRRVYDRKGDSHYDAISAFIKSMRASDADAALHYLARMLEAGEDPVFIARRMVIFASEDVGNADPRGLLVAVACAQAVQLIGLPECAINLAHGVTYLSLAPKSNASYMGLKTAQADLEKKRIGEIPMHLRNAPHSGMKEYGAGKGYQYPHDHPDALVSGINLPEGLEDEEYYHPKDVGLETRFKERWEAIRRFIRGSTVKDKP